MSDESSLGKASDAKQKNEAQAENKEESKSIEEVKEKDSNISEIKSEVEVPTKFKKLVEQIEQMSVLDLSELVKILEEKFGVSAMPVAAAGIVPATGGADAAAAEEKDSFNVELTSVGDNKIGAIKVVREVIGKGLKDAKDMVEGAPVVVKEDAKKDEAEEIKKKLEEAGAQVTLK